LKRIWYHIVKIYIRTGLHFFFKEIRVVGTENIPKKGALLFVSNHKNALVDPLLIATTTTRNIHFLTRASAFKLTLVKWMLSTVNMLPIYRLRDGKETLAKNTKIFNKCNTILNKKRSLLIFPEGTHDIRRWVRPLSKGFTRITFGALEQNPELDLTIIPVGLNYTKADEFASSVSIHYGKPIIVNHYYDRENINLSTQQLKAIVHEKMTEVTTHISSIENYDAVIEQLGTIDYLDPSLVNNKLANTQISNVTVPSKSPTLLWQLLKIMVSINSIIPISIYKAIEPKIQEIEFVSTTKLAVGITAFPLFYVLQAIVVSYFFGWQVACIYLCASVLLVFVLVKQK
jgi:1-acyl-sn-glycerol-3-phosphate acyltransferase